MQNPEAMIDETNPLISQSRRHRGSRGSGPGRQARAAFDQDKPYPGLRRHRARAGGVRQGESYRQGPSATG